MLQNDTHTCHASKATSSVSAWEKGRLGCWGGLWTATEFTTGDPAVGIFLALPSGQPDC